SVMLAVVPSKPVHTIPHRSNPVLLGLVGIRGRLRLAIDVGSLLGIEGSADGQRSLLVSHQGQDFVFPVDRVIGLERLPLRELASARAGSCRRGVLPFEGQPLTVLDTEKLWNSIRELARL
ncbi:MAG: chemotaxis protein CheW, partial [Candidatus Eremiobacteraeota bacterium]|nr:chemotaxis protein CheW [Candidatus Eremiobacteraeota bacterium]